ncbi:Serrate RNA effector molecule [Hypsizygus marmoreus]|uniref:Serrate RNA effector molecule n=1 Tax=Hypsizygus marmoreus TaxID=39966 RepID=A0A369JBC6_HYPMA|nr:Serrate RNA effector molecule [Hypsizygus marmoreus]
MSWTYPPRSRSRSPRSRPSYTDPSQEPYRPEWDTYDRDRAWTYERDRAAYEYGRRGRSRSPPPDEAGRKRRRSTSPYDRDRYEPRPRYSDDYDAHSRGGYGYSSPRRGHAPPYTQSRRAPPDPHTFDYPASLKQYAEWFRYFYPQQALEEDNADKAAEQDAGDGSKPRNGIKSKWEKYKKDFAATQLQTMFEHHRKSPWFAEKYDPAPECQNLRMRVRKEGWKGRLDSFLHDLESGKYDPDLNEPELEPLSPSKENIVNGETTAEPNGAPSVVPAEEPKSMGGGDDDMQFNVEADEEPGDQEPSRPDTNGKVAIDRRTNRGEEVSVAPEGNQVMIRTIPPDIGRLKLEEACSKIPGFVYLALGDPLQKRNYYRAGWLRFTDDSDMTAVVSELSDKKIEGFKLHVTHNQRPFVNRIRYAPEVASRPERIQKDLATAKELAAVLEDQAAKLRQFKPPPPATTEGAQPENQADATMAPPEPEEMEEEPEPKENGSDAVERRIEKIMADMREHGLIDVNDEKAYEEKKAVISLDLYIAYLRAAFNTCYYCSVVTDHLEELQRKCLQHARRPLSQAMLDEMKAADAEKAEKEKVDKDEDMAEADGADKDSEKEKDTKKEGSGKDRRDERDWKRNDERWLEWLDSKLALLINRDGVDPRTYSGKSYDEELTKAVAPFLKQEDEGKFRCKTCQKLFKATSFVEKHIANKHPELVKHLDDIPYFNNFALDPHHIQPFTHPPPVIGNSQAPPPQAYGLQGPPAYHGGEYGRPGPYYGGGGGGGGYPPAYPPPYHGNYWDNHGYQNGPPGPYGPPGGYPPPPPPSSRRDESMTARRLSDRISGYAPGTDNLTLPVGAGLPPKPTAAALDSALVSGNGGERERGGGRRGRNGGGGNLGPPPPPPPDAKEDPRAAAGKRVSYHDMDLVAEGDVELFY